MVAEGILTAFWAGSKKGYKAKPLSVCLQTPRSPCAVSSRSLLALSDPELGTISQKALQCVALMFGL